MIKDLERINKSLEENYQKLLQLCKELGIDIDELQKKLEERYAEAM